MDIRCRERLIFIIMIINFSCFSQTIDEVYKELNDQGVKHPDIVLAQSILETGWYKCSPCSMDYNNIFGLWNSRKQEYYKFETWQKSVTGYLNKIQYKYKEGDYFKFLTDLGYAEDPNYIYKVKKIMQGDLLIKLKQ